MALDQPFPDLDELLATIGAAGQRLGGLNASEGAAGNISMYIGWPVAGNFRKLPTGFAFTGTEQGVQIPQQALARFRATNMPPNMLM